MKKLFLVVIGALTIFSLATCKKSPDYVAVPHKCSCGTFQWQGVSYDLLNANYINSDSLEDESRRYYIVANSALTGEDQTHGLSAWIEIPDLDGGGQFHIEPGTDDDPPVTDFMAWVDEFNLNDPIDTLRQYIPVNAVVQVSEAPLTGGVETVSFQMTLNQVIDGSVVPGDVNCSGSFTVYINQ